MAIKLGTENKRNVWIAVGLFCILVWLAVSQLMGPSTAPPRPANQAAARPAAAPAARTNPTAAGSNAGPEAHKVANSGLDPALHLERLALSETIEYAGSGRNIFSAESAPVAIPVAVATGRNVPAPPVNTGPPPPPQPPQIDLHYFGYSADRAGKREAFLLHGDDIFEATAGEIVNHRYKVVAVEPRSVQVTDLSYNNTQTLPLMAN